MVIRFTLVLLILSSPCFASTIIHAGALIDGISNQTRQNVSIVIKDNSIHEIQSGHIKGQANDQIIDLKKHTVLPGLMDMHTHLIHVFHKKSYSDKFFLNPTDYALRASDNAKKTLLAGFTTVRDLGDSYNVSVALRKAINKGWIIGPRIFTATKSIATSGGHADPTNGLNDFFGYDPKPHQGVINGPVEARKAVRERYKDGADLIKITGTGGVLSKAKSGKNPQFMKDEFEAIVQTAKDYNMTVAVHAHGKEGMKRAVLAGVTSIEHGTYMDQEIMRLMIQKGTYYVPTILAGNWVAQKAKVKDFFPEIIRSKAATIGPLIEKTFAKAYKAGVKIAFGTDTGVSPHGENAKEFSLMVKNGMPPMKAIQSATMEAAKLLKIQDKLGSVTVGKTADLIAVLGDPLKDISILEKVDFVMKEGQVFKKP